jgi:hypothetical protein
MPTNIASLQDREQIAELNQVVLKACHPDPNRPAEEEIHRIRIQQALAHAPRLLNIVSEGESNIGALSPDSLRLISAHRPPDGGVKLTLRPLETGEVIWERLIEDVSIGRLRFTADGRRLLVRSFQQQARDGSDLAPAAHRLGGIGRLQC